MTDKTQAIMLLMDGFEDAEAISGNLITCKGLGHCFEFGAAIARALGCDLAATKTQHEHIYCEPQKLDFLQ
ncbi:MAG: hypothetical protein ROM54_12495 [Anaerobiospirillum sp.]|nr:hypothetical protein [Anaerobiospirillum sp.]